MKILVGSKNPVKIQATYEAFIKYFSNIDIVGVGVDTGVAEQPLNEETLIF